MDRQKSIRLFLTGALILAGCTSKLSGQKEVPKESTQNGYTTQSIDEIALNPSIPSGLTGEHNWLAMAGDTGVEPGIQAKIISTTDPSWERHETLNTEPFSYTFEWLKDGKTIQKITIKPEDGCVKIGGSKVQLTGGLSQTGIGYDFDLECPKIEE